MLKIPMEKLDEEAATIAEKEKWANTVAQYVVELGVHPNIDFDLAVRSARCASLWIDIFSEKLQSGEGVGLKEALEDSRDSAIQRSEGLVAYPVGVPTIRSIIAMNEAFLVTFQDPDDRAHLRGIIYPQDDNEES